MWLPTRSNSRSDRSSCDAARNRRTSMTSRRSFLLGISALVSASFVTRVKAHVLESARPLLLEPKRAQETLYLYDQSGWDDDWKWRVSLGPDDVHEPPPP